MHHEVEKMSVKEEKREEAAEAVTKEKPRERIEEKEKELPREQVRAQKLEAREEVERVFELPEWVEYPWMYVRPKQEVYLESWLKSWADLLLKWAAANFEYVISVAQLAKVYPFSKLSVEDLKEIFSYLVKKGFAKWRSDTSVRLFWKSLEDLADELYEYAIKSGILELTPYTLMAECPEKFKKLPPEELPLILSILVKKGKARWMKKKVAVRLQLP